MTAARVYQAAMRRHQRAAEAADSPQEAFAHEAIAGFAERMLLGRDDDLDDLDDLEEDFDE